MASFGLEPLVVRMRGNTGTALRGVPHRVEHLLDAGPMSPLRSPVAMDLVPSLLGMVPARRLVRGGMTRLGTSTSFRIRASLVGTGWTRENRQPLPLAKGDMATCCDDRRALLSVGEDELAVLRAVA